MGLTANGSFGDYRVVRRLGKGGMGEVWLLEGPSGQQIAAKILDPVTAEADRDARRRFLREAELALGVRHPNLVETYDVGEDPETGLCYILMEYVPGGTLAKRIRDSGALPIADAVSIVSSIANVLELGRRKGIVHRDIKPANIMFAADGTPKLADLGIARRDSGVETTTVTQTGVMMGTPAYMSPEQMFDSHNVDTRADIYSLGVVFFEMLTGQRPNKDDTVVQLMARAMKGEPLPDVRTLRPEVSASLAQLLGMMVAPDREVRISTPRQISTALAVIVRGGEIVLSPKGGTVVVVGPGDGRSRRRLRTVWRVLVLIGLAAAVALTVWKFRHLKDWLDSHSWSGPFFGQKVTRMVVVPEVERWEPDPGPKTSPPAIVPPANEATNVAPAIVPPANAATNVAPKTVAQKEPVSDDAPARVECPREETNGLSVRVERPVATNDAPKVAEPPPAPKDERPEPPSVRRTVKPARPAPRVPVRPQEEVHACEFVPYFKDWLGKRRFPEKIETVEIRGCKTAETRRKRNEQGGESVVVSFSGKKRAICFLTIAAEGRQKVVSVQLNPQMPGRIEVNMSE